ncbi:hypothetical protein CA983_24450 [Streptomyces swartbergensis]|uniref:Uncharacterized protein n=1 Tax=Streptomyces swartbergensis TaxID=487165 RepID=A0A243S1E2_9ACTN|nr:hypothetical protein CA983_24450 [Streptomyces swartbergensis]
MENRGDSTSVEGRFGVRDGLGIGGVILCLIVGMGAILLFVGLWKRIARETVPVLVDLPGGPWTTGGILGSITVLGAVGGMRCASGISGGTLLVRGMRAASVAVCCTATFGPLFLMLSGLPGRNCHSADCAYIPGTGSALLAYVISVGAVGWPLRRWSRARAEERTAQERQRIRRLRKKGKGKSRAAQGR